MKPAKPMDCGALFFEHIVEVADRAAIGLPAPLAPFAVSYLTIGLLLACFQRFEPINGRSTRDRKR